MGVVIGISGSGGGGGDTVTINDNGDGTVTVTINGSPTTFNSDDFDRYANLAAFPATGDQDIIYLDEATNTLYQWDGAAYQSLGGSGTDQFEKFANLAAFPATGDTNVLYMAQDTNILYEWDGAAYNQVGSAGGSIEVEDDGTSLTTAATKINFVGFTVTEPVADEITVSNGQLDFKELSATANVISPAWGDHAWLPLNGGGIANNDTFQLPAIPAVTGTDGVLAELIYNNQTNHTLNIAFDAGDVADITSDTIHVLAGINERKIPPNRGGFITVRELGGERYVEIEGVTEFG